MSNGAAAGHRTIHDNESDTSAATVRALLAAERPDWVQLPLTAVDATGTDHAMWRLGDQLVVRLPRTDSAAASLQGEQRHLPLLRGELPVPVPEVAYVGCGSPEAPRPWAVLTWLSGRDGWTARDEVSDTIGLADDLARLVHSLRGVDVEVFGPLPRREPGQRGGPVGPILDRVTTWCAQLEQLARPDAGLDPSLLERLPDPAHVTRVAAADAARGERTVDPRATRVTAVSHRQVLTHGDLIPGNILIRDGRLAGVIDWGYLSFADPALDLVPAWAILDTMGRARFRTRLGDLGEPVDDATWARARLNALEQAIGGIAYYTTRRHPLADVMSRTLDRILAEA